MAERVRTHFKSLYDAFRCFDADGNGRVSSQELKNIISNYFFPISGPQVRYTGVESGYIYIYIYIYIHIYIYIYIYMYIYIRIGGGFWRRHMRKNTTSNISSDNAFLSLHILNNICGVSGCTSCLPTVWATHKGRWVWRQERYHLVCGLSGQGNYALSIVCVQSYCSLCVCSLIVSEYIRSPFGIWSMHTHTRAHAHTYTHTHTHTHSLRSKKTSEGTSGLKVLIISIRRLTPPCPSTPRRKKSLDFYALLASNLNNSKRVPQFVDK